MKTVFFLVIVLVSSYYLLSKTDTGSAILNSSLLSRYLPQQQIDKASDNLLKNVDSRLQKVIEKVSLEQQQGLQQLEHRISLLSQQLGELETQQKLDNQPNIAEQPRESASENPNTNVSPSADIDHENLLAQAEQEKQHDKDNDIKESLGSDDGVTVAQNMNNDIEDERRALQRQKQSSLQFISSRMEQMAVKVSSGAY